MKLKSPQCGHRDFNELNGNGKKQNGEEHD